MSQSKSVQPFDILNGLNRKILYSAEEVQQAKLKNYLLLTFIRGNNILLPIANYLNENRKIDIYSQYLFVYFSFVRFNISNVKWIKSDKTPKQEDIEMIMKYYYVKYTVAQTYLERINKKELNHIKEYYRTGGVNNKVQIKTKKKK